MSISRKVEIRMAEALVETLLEEVGPSAFMAAINNVCCHGTIFLQMSLNLDNEDKTLGKWYEGIELMASAAREMEN